MNAISYKQLRAFAAQYGAVVGLICVISVKLQEAEFEGQTKAKLGNTEIRTLVSNMVYSKLMEFFEENPGVAKAIFEKATQAARARAAAKKARELVRRKSALGIILGWCGRGLRLFHGVLT